VSGATSSGTLVAPGHHRIWLGMALAKVGLHLPALTQYGWFRDELYYVASTQRLAWGYVDHPPLSIAILWPVVLMAGESLAAIRLVPVLAGAASVYLTGRLARELGGGGFAQALACLAALVAPVLLGGSRFYSMNALDLLLWTAAASLLVAALEHRRPRDWVWLGVVMGLGLLNKLSMTWFLLGTFAGLALSGHRRHLLTPWPWVAGVIAGVVFLPYVVWQVANGWPTLEFMRNAAQGKMVEVSFRDFLAGQLRVMGPANALVYVPGLLFGLFAAVARPWRILAILFLVVAALLVAAGTSRAGYLAVAYPVLLALGGVAWERWTRERRKFARPVLLASVGLLGAPLIPLALPILTPGTFIRYQAVLGQQPTTEERKRVGPLPQGYADMFGWEELVAEVAKAHRLLSPEERSRAVVFGQNYGEAGAVDVLGRRLGLPRAVSGHNSYWLWGPGDWDGSVMIIIGGDPADNAGWFEEVEQVGVWDHPYAMPYERGLGIFVARRFKYPLAESWGRLKNFN
jgi:4-amino-4-deoxy-L-arabinose transferase-like glycosyltransferase